MVPVDPRDISRGALSRDLGTYKSCFTGKRDDEGLIAGRGRVDRGRRVISEEFSIFRSLLSDDGLTTNRPTAMEVEVELRGNLCTSKN